ncbi:hypothetical protein ACPPVU_12710 [Mucilaginibacter sp. McL0603]|uniref:hypothetical protein n=1 Tax=Mucilaginibacter sp. McL0603 TaxID=3415670 RepID=UPI003CF63912
MLRASALYMVIVIALVIALLCSSLIVVAYYYRAEYQKKFRYDQLENNLSSGINILLTSTDSTYSKKTTLSLFNNDQDSVTLKKINWGIFDIGVVNAFIQHDTISRIFSIGNMVDSTKWCALYLANQDRPLSVSGKTNITGNAFIPKAGIKKAYVNSQAYQGDERLINGKINNSEKKLPALQTSRVSILQNYLSKTDQAASADSNLVNIDTIRNSFSKPTRIIHFGKRAGVIKNVYLEGNIILFSDTTLTIDHTATLNNVLVFAPAIVVNSAFRGTCQLFATDSIHVQSDCVFSYPSCLGVLNTKSSKTNPYVKLTLGKNTIFNGAVITYRQNNEEIMPILLLDSNVRVTGQIYSQGMLGYKNNMHVNGSVFTKLFTYQSTFNLMENTLINANISSRALSSYYLSSELFPIVSKRKKILQWLE